MEKKSKKLFQAITEEFNAVCGSLDIIFKHQSVRHVQKLKNLYETQANKNGKSASLKPLDPLLEKYEFEYQYLFSVVNKYSKEYNKDLATYYYLKNIARRLLEGF